MAQADSALKISELLQNASHQQVNDAYLIPTITKVRNQNLEGKSQKQLDQKV